MSERPIEISIYTNRTAVQPPRRARAGLSMRASRAARGTIAATICLIAHCLIYTEAMWGTGAPSTNSKELPTRSSVASDSDPDAMQWVALDPGALTDPMRPNPELPSPHLQAIRIPKALAKVALLIPDIDLRPTPDASVADAARLSKLYGRYVGQIAARIDRAWLRPRTAIGAPEFSCQVRITQDADGRVLEQMLEQCNGDSRWQLSLVQAIQSASPLPAPPDPDVFSRTLHLAFTGEAYSPENPADQYESQRVTREVQSVADTRAADEALTNLSNSHAPVALKLTITGDHKTLEFLNITDAALDSGTTRPP